MKTKYLVPMVALAAMASACSDEDIEGVVVNKVTGNDIIEATMGNGDTRTYMQEDKVDDTNPILWANEDQFAVLTDATDASNAKVAYTLTTGAGSNTGSFLGSYEAETNGNKIAAFYPYNATDLTLVTTTEDDNAKTYSVTYTMPSEITLNTDSATALNGFPMVALFGEETGSVTFKNAAALLDLQVSGIPEGYNVATLTSVASSTDATAPSLNGKATITFSDGVPTLAITGDGTAQTTLKWTAAPSGAQTIRALVPIPVGSTYTLKLAVGKETTSDDEETAVTPITVATLKTVVAERNIRYIRTVSLQTITGGIARAVPSAADATKALAGTDNAEATNAVAITEVEAEGSITIPANQSGTTSGAAPVGLLLNGAASGAKLTVAQGTAEGYVPSGSVTIAAAGAGANSNFLDELTLDLPVSAVTLEAQSEGTAVVYGKVTASTASDTLVIGSGVTVTELVLSSKVSVIVKDGGTVGSVSLADGVASADLYYEGASSSVPTSATNVKINQAEVYYLNHLQAGETFTLTRDITTNDYTIVLKNNNVTVDLDGYTISRGKTNNTVEVQGTKVLIKNVNEDSSSDNTTTVTAKTTGGITSTSTGNTIYINGGSVVLNGLNLQGGKNVVRVGNSGTVTVMNCTVTSTSSGAGNALSMNGGTATTSNTTFNVASSHTGVPILVSNSSTVYLNAGTIINQKDNGNSLGVDAVRPVEISNGSSVEINGAAIYGYNSDIAVLVDNKSSLTMSAGSVQGNNIGIKLQKNSSATLSGGTIETQSNDALELVDTDSSFGPCSATISGGATLITHAADRATVFVQPLGTQVTGRVMNLTISGKASITNDAGYWAICGNGTCHGTNIEISGATTIAATGTGAGAAAIYHPQDGTLTIKKSDDGAPTITGEAAAIELRSGTLNISGGTFTATATTSQLQNHGDTEAIQNETSTTDGALVTANGNGSTTYGAAIAIAQHTTKKDINVNISGGTFTGYYAFRQANPQGNTTDNVTLAISGGTFDGKIGSVLTSKFITGGSFTSNSTVADYIATNYGLSSSADSDGYYTVSANQQ